MSVVTVEWKNWSHTLYDVQVVMVILKWKSFGNKLRIIPTKPRCSEFKCVSKPLNEERQVFKILRFEWISSAEHLQTRGEIGRRWRWKLEVFKSFSLLHHLSHSYSYAHSDIMLNNIPGVFPPYISAGSLGPGRGNNGKSKLVRQLALRGCSTIGVLITAGNLSVTTMLSGHFSASEIMV